MVACVLAVAGCGGEARVGSPSDVTPPVVTDGLPPTTFSTPDECGEVPEVALVSGDASVTMDLVFYGESTDACGYNADGKAMFDDSFRPASALLAEGGELSVVGNVVGEFSVDIRPLEPGLRLASIEPSPDVLSSSEDGSYVLALTSPGCSVVTVGFLGEGRNGRFTGLVESEIDACANVPQAVDEVTVVAVHEDFSFYGPCGDNSLDVFGTTYYQLYAEEVEALDESRYPHAGDMNGPEGFARVAPPGPGDDVGTLIVYSDGMARYESESGIVEWLTTELHTYNWVC